MSFSLSVNSPTSMVSNSLSEVLGTKLSNNQQELEGQMALQLIESANPETTTPVNIGTHVNIKV